MFRMGDVSIDTGTRQVTRCGEELQLPALSYDLLLALVRRAPNVVTSDELMREVWAGRVVNDETVAKRVELVRGVLGDDSRNARYIAVVRGRGYRVIAPVEPLASDGPAAAGAPPATVPRTMKRRLTWFAISVGVLAVALAGWLWPRGPLPPEQPVLAVLPLDDLSQSNVNGYFADGMHDALIADLSKIGGIRVISRTSTLPYRDSGKSLTTIVGELGVNLVMEGSVLRADDRVRITLQLIDARDRHLWAENYEGDLRDVLKLQNDVARTVAQAVRIKLSAREDALLGAQPAVNVKSYELYLEGKQLAESPNPGDFDAGVAKLARATELDPTSALPYAHLAMIYAQRAHAPGAAKTLYPRATSYALQAIGLDPNVAEAHAALAQLRLYFHWDYVAAEESFRKLFELAPSFAPAHGHYGWLRVLHGDYRGAIKELRLAAELDPRFLLWASWLGWVHLWNGDFTTAEQVLLDVLEQDPNYPVALHVLGQTYLRLDRVDDAIATFRKAGEASPRWSWGLGQGLAAAGKIDEARSFAQTLEAREQPDAWALAEIYSATGDLDKAAEWVERGYESRRDWMPWIQANIFLEPLHAHPRFREIVRRLALPQ